MIETQETLDAKILAKEQYLIARDEVLAASDAVSKLWRGYRNHVACRDYDAALNYIADMPDCLASTLARFYITKSKEHDRNNILSGLRDSLYVFPEIAEFEAAKRDAIKEGYRVQDGMVNALVGLIDAWSGVYDLLEAKDYAAAFKSINEMPDSAAQMALMSLALDCKEGLADSIDRTLRAKFARRLSRAPKQRSQP